MPKPVPPVLSVIVRRFRREFADDIEPAIHHIQKAAAGQPGFIGLQNSISPKRDDCELVTVITFDTPENLEKWENSPARKRFVLELDSLSNDDATNTRFKGLSLLAHPAAQISKAETVLILIAWILVLSNLLPYPLDLKWSCFFGQVRGLVKMHQVDFHAAFSASVWPKYAVSGVRLSRAV